MTDTPSSSCGVRTLGPTREITPDTSRPGVYGNS
eukprot:CAMPEP_0171569492 /NCGR_PEP_ID=MMETSP0961-20121227/2375_1 /TAXON_ID=87120 /ORGANISM="Aurantiochytrium limacinum, Strain ATCCMYA-1381" /LENGTH=33 /DNA_ID= /DNA_START= /DNA_END= /DNA_ORIENTATION=